MKPKNLLETSHIEPDWSLTITKADNGYIVERMEQLLDGENYRRYYTLVVASDTEDDTDEMKHLLYEVANFFDPNAKIEIKERE